MDNKTFLWSEGILSACKYLGLPELPKDIETIPEHAPLPSDFLGNNFELDQRTIDSLKKSCRLSDERYKKIFIRFKTKYASQKIFEHNSTDLNIFFVDYLLSARKKGYNIPNYFDFEFYHKTFDEQKTFLGNDHLLKMHVIFNRFSSFKYLNNKAISNRVYAKFIHRDWLDMTTCYLEEFCFFVKKHEKFFVKPAIGSGGRGSRVITPDPQSQVDIDKIFYNGQTEKLIVEEIIKQHSAIAEFCPDTLNTIRINTLIDKHGTVRILTAAGRFGRLGRVVDNFHSGGYSVIIDPITGIIISDALNMVHQRTDRHPDTGKVFRGFQYPCWNKVRAMAIDMAKVVPSLRHVGWDIAINTDGNPEFVEGNEDPGSDIQQAADSVGRLHLYQRFIDEWEQYDREHLREVGYVVNNINDFERSYQMQDENRRDRRVPFVLDNLIDGCKSLLDVGCRESKAVKNNCPAEIEYHAIDYKKYDDEVIECDFNAGSFPDLVVDTCLSIHTAEYVELLPEFLNNLCQASRRQVLMLCRPVDKEIHARYRWRHPFAVDFTEDFLVKSMERSGFFLHQMKTDPENRSIVLYDFRRR